MYYLAFSGQKFTRFYIKFYILNIAYIVLLKYYT